VITSQRLAACSQAKPVILASDASKTTENTPQIATGHQPY
jgi:hypothetical protein